MLVVVAVALGVTYVLFLVFVTPFMDNTRPQQQSQLEPAVSTVVFVEGAASGDAPNNGIAPKVITVVIGVNNTVRWTNQDSIPHGFPIPDNDNIDPDFAKFIAQKYDESAAFIIPE